MYLTAKSTKYRKGIAMKSSAFLCNCSAYFALKLFVRMSPNSKLILIKVLHTIIWLFFNVVIFYLLYAVIIDKIDKWIWICIGLIVLEGIILIIFKKVCPVTIMARKYSDSDKDNFDIYLPNWLARHNKLIYTIIVLIAVFILGYRLMYWS